MEKCTHCLYPDMMNAALDVPVMAESSAENVVRHADVLICATSSPTPVFDADWLQPGTHVNTIGPKFREAHEIPPEVAERSRVIATDSLDQVAKYAQPFFLSGTPEQERMVELPEIVVGHHRGRTSAADLTLFCSVGLAGTEVVLAKEVLDLARRE